jgi:hypothetical protein
MEDSVQVATSYRRRTYVNQAEEQTLCPLLSLAAIIENNAAPLWVIYGGLIGARPVIVANALVIAAPAWTAGSLGDKLAGKIVVDPSNPIAPDASGGFKKITPPDQSSGQILAGLLPPGVKFVKAFGSLRRSR